MMKMLRDESGNVLIMTALSLTMLIAFMALAIDVGNIFYSQRQLQTLADSAAIAGALEIKTCNGTTNCAAMQTAATTALSEGSPSVSSTLFTQCAAASGSGVLLTVNNGPCALAGDPNAGNADYVEAVVTQAVPSYFAKIFGKSSYTVSARAEAGYAVAAGGSPCIYTNNLQINGGGATIQDGDGSNCGIYDSGTATDDSPITVKVGYYNVQGAITNNCSGCTTVVPQPTKGATVVDPYPASSMTVPTGVANSSTANLNNFSANATLEPGTYPYTLNCNSGTYTITLEPGIYYFAGGLNADTNVTFVGTGGVTLFFGNGSNVNVNSSAIFDIVAPTAAQAASDGCASCAGIALWDTTGSLNLDTSTSSSIGGSIYLPNGTLQLNSDSTLNITGTIDAKAVSVDAGAVVNLDGNGAGGAVNGSPTISLAE